MFPYHVKVIFLGVFLPLSLSQELRHSSMYTSTENEFEFDFDKGAQIQESDSALTAKTLFVGGFQLEVGDEFTSKACDLIEDQFLLHTDCACNLSTLNSSMVQFGCKNKHLSCNEQDYCAQSVYTGTVGYETTGTHISTDFCLNNLQKDGINFGNLCVAIDGSTVDNNLRIKRCRAQIGKRKCDCTVCGDGGGIRVDCTDIDSRLISRNCDVIDIVTNIEQQDRKVAGIFPSFMP